MIEADVRTFLLAQSAVSALIGTRMYPLRLPQGVTFPALTYQRISGSEDVTHSGAGPARAGMQFDCWGQTQSSVLALASAVRSALSGHRSGMGDSPLVNAFVVNVLDLPEPDIPLWRRMIEVSFLYDETIA